MVLAQIRSVAPGVVLAVAAVCVCCLTVAALGGNAPLALSRLVIEDAAALIWALSALGLGAGILRLSTYRTTNTPLHLATAFGLGFGLLAIAQLFAGIFGLLSQPAGWLLLTPGLLAGVWLLRDAPLPTAAQLSTARSAIVRWWPVLLAPLLAAGLFLALVPPGLLWSGEPNRYDVLAYHFQLPREWLEMGRIVPLRHNVFSFFPLAMEMHYLTAMQLLGGPWAGGYTAQAMHLLTFVFAGVAMYGAVLPAGRVPAALAGAAVVSAPIVLLLAPIGYNEGPVVLFGALVVAHLFTAPAGLPSVVVAGLCAGFAAGVKLTALPLYTLLPALLLLAWPVATRRWFLSVLLFCGASLLAASPWLVRTAFWADGNPVFPLAASTLGPAHFTPEQVTRFALAHAPRPDQQSLSARLAEFAHQVAMAPEFGYVLLPLALFGGAYAVRKPGPARPLLLMLAGHIAVWLFATHLQGRFFVPTLPLVAALLALAATARPVQTLAALALAFSAGFSLYLAASRLDLLRDPATGQLSAAVVALDYKSPLPGVAGLETSLIPADVLSVPAGLTLTLVGDARAYLYTRPTARLKYTSVFDLTGSDLPTAYRVAPTDALWIDPGEIRRFVGTYYAVPPLPAVWDRPAAFVLPPRE